MITRAIVVEAARLSTAGRLLKEAELAKLSPEQQRLLHTVLRDAQDAIDREKRTVRLWPHGPRIRM